MTLDFANVVTIEGATGAGKTTLLTGIALRFGVRVIELGPVVRSVALLAESRRIPIADAASALATLDARGRVGLVTPKLTLLTASEVAIDGSLPGNRLFADMLAPAIHAASTDAVAIDTAHRIVRGYLVGQRVVLSGRDVSKHLCPSAPIQIRLEAAEAVRASRKGRQLESMQIRGDWLDDAIRLGPRHDGQVVVDTTTKTPAGVLHEVSLLLEHRLGWRPVAEVDASDTRVRA